MDGKLNLDKNIVPLNYWNINMLKEKEVFDTQKGIVRTIDVKILEDEKINILDNEILANKFLLNVSKNPKDKGPFQSTHFGTLIMNLLKWNSLILKIKKILLKLFVMIESIVANNLDYRRFIRYWFCTCYRIFEKWLEGNYFFK